MRSNAAIGIVFNEDRTEVLLVKRQDVPVWVLPGGGVDINESYSSAAVREILEETGLQVEVIRKVAEYTPINRLGKYTETFECHLVKGELKKSDETDDLGFYPLSNLPEDLLPIHIDWIDDAILNENKVIKKYLTNLTYWSLVKYFIRHPLWVIRFLRTLRLKK